MTSQAAQAIRARIVELCDQWGADNVHVLEENEELATVLVTEPDVMLQLALPFRFYSVRPERLVSVPMRLKGLRMNVGADGNIDLSGRFLHPPAPDATEIADHAADKLRGEDHDGH